MQRSVFERLAPRPRKVATPKFDRFVPHIIPVGQVASRNDRTAMAVESVLCWPTGFTLNVSVFCHPSAPQRLHLALISHPMDPHHVPDLDGPCFGVVFPDGRKITNVDQLYYDRQTAAELTLTPASASSGEFYLRQGLYIEPLPREGSLTVAARWRALELEEGRIELSADSIIAGADKALMIWD